MAVSIATGATSALTSSMPTPPGARQKALDPRALARVPIHLRQRPHSRSQRQPGHRKRMVEREGVEPAERTEKSISY